MPDKIINSQWAIRLDYSSGYNQSSWKRNIVDASARQLENDVCCLPDLVLG